jgi:hypothetical protein
MKKYIQSISTEKIKSVSVGTLDAVDSMVTTTAQQFDSFAEPMRKSFAERYPTLFLMIATFGLSATFLGIEQLLLSIGLFARHPMLILVLGVVTLMLTGTLYKKLH